MKIFVTGGAGFIGSHLVEALLAGDNQVCVIDNFDAHYDFKIKEDNISSFKENKNLMFYREDIRSTTKITKRLKDFSPDVVVHLAAKAGVRPSLAAPMEYVENNIKGTVSLLESMKEASINKFIFASSSSVYGASKIVPFKEDACLDSAISVYAATKQAGESFTKMYHNLYGFDVINLRFFTVYGPRQRPDLAIHKFLKANFEGREIEIYGDGSMARDYTFVRDTVAGIIGAIKRVASLSNVYETYNLGNSTPISLIQLISTIEKITGKKSLVRYSEVPKGDVPITFADIKKANQNLSYCPSMSFEDGVVEFSSWMKDYYGF